MSKRSKRSKRLLIVCPYALGIAPSQRFRFELFLDVCSQEGNRPCVAPFWSRRSFTYLYKRGFLAGFWKIWGLCEGYTKRFRLLWQYRSYSCVLIHREVTPFGAPCFAWLMYRFKSAEQRIVFDFDDAIWKMDASVSAWKTWVKCPQKTIWLCRWADVVLAGNTYLLKYAQKHTKKAVLLPTMVDTEGYHVPVASRIRKKEALLTLGWTGTHSTLPYLDVIWEVLEALCEHIDFRFIVIANQPPKVGYDWVKYVRWRKESEIEDLQKIDIGLMPLQDDAWSAGKCGFKLLQYLALEVPALASPVGVNSAIIQHGISGYLCATQADWLENLQKLAGDHKARREMGKNGRLYVRQHYSPPNHARTFMDACALL